MTFKVMPEVQLRVDSAYPGDQGGGKARLDPETMLLLKISPGDLVVIEGKRRTVAKVWRSLVEDWNQRKIRIDNFTRVNAGVAIGDSVKISTLTEEIEAKRVVLAPPEDLPKKIPIANNPHVINGLLDFPVVKNDSIPIMLGLPFIPGSAVKGVCRHGAMEELINAEGPKQAEVFSLFRRVFGTADNEFTDGNLQRFRRLLNGRAENQKGGIAFLPAYPVNQARIIVDLTNVHYPDYYRTGRVEDLSKERPQPNPFPAVEVGAQFAFCFVLNGLSDDPALLQAAAG